MTKRLIRFSFIGALWAPLAFAHLGPTHECLQEIALQAKIYQETLSRDYVTKAGEVLGKTPLQNESVFIPGDPKKEAVLILHGFASAPNGLSSLIQEAAQGHHTVYAPLIPGWGSSPQVANMYGRREWRKSVDDSYRLLSKCFSSMAVVGFSMGAALAMDFVFDRYDTLRAEIGGARLNSANFVSPFMRFKGWKLWLAYHFYSRIGNQVSLVELKRRAGRMPTPDLDIMIANPGLYGQFLPLPAITEILKLRDDLQASRAVVGKDLKVLMATSLGDGVTDQRISREFAIDHFPNIRLLQFPATLAQPVPHMMYLHDPTDPVAQMVSREIIRHVHSCRDEFELAVITTPI